VVREKGEAKAWGWVLWIPNQIGHVQAIALSVSRFFICESGLESQPGTQQTFSYGGWVMMSSGQSSEPRIPLPPTSPCYTTLSSCHGPLVPLLQWFHKLAIK
jgi:hypothetical protein